MTESPTHTTLELFASDIDGTLLTSDHRITDEVRAAIARARELGVHVILASARSPQAIALLQDELNLVGEPLVALQGAWVGRVTPDGTAPLAQHRISPEDARAVVAAAAAVNTPLSWFNSDAWYYTMEADVVGYETRVTGIAPAGVLDVDTALVEGGPLKLMVPPNPAQPDAVAEVLATLPDSLIGQMTGEHYLEITQPDADKSHGVALIAEQFGVSPVGIAAAGDGPNDIGMFTLAHRSYAMGNAGPAVKAEAGQVVADNNNSGLAAAIAHALGT
ncbi:hypothetical protein SAMN06309944_1568 [Micrococcales bacterium KH10]|nr:hypothetical protein SAMN06309944_1568 [Micrococcales bacterium KH10]